MIVYLGSVNKLTLQVLIFLYNGSMKTEPALTEMFKNIWPHLGERERRLLAAAEAQRIGYGGISLASKSCKLSRVTITKAMSTT
jgi:hypothetical protein